MVPSPWPPSLRLTTATTGFACVVSFVGCGGSSSSQGLAAAPTPVKCQTSLAGMPSNFSASGGQIGARVLTSPECAWSATSDAAWVQVDPTAGQGESDITVRVAQNELPASRTGSVHVNGVQLTLSQEPAIVEPEPPAPRPTPPPPPRSPPSPNPPRPSPPPPAPSVVYFAGPVSGLSGSCPALSFVVGGRRVVTDGNTKFTQGNCKHMSNGLDISITGTVSNGSVHATRVEMKNDLSAQLSGWDVWRRSRQASWGTLRVVPQCPHTQTSIAFTRVATVMRSIKQTGQRGISSPAPGGDGSTIRVIVENLTVAVDGTVVTRVNPATAVRKTLHASGENTGARMRAITASRVRYGLACLIWRHNLSSTRNA